MIKKFALGLSLLVSISTSAQISPTANDGIVSSIYGLKSLFVEQQYQFLPIGPPSEDVLVQPYGPVVPVDWKKFPKEFTKQMYAEMDANGFPLYRLSVFEDPVTRETVFLNSYEIEVYRLAADKDYDPYAWQKVKFNLETGQTLDDWNRWIFDPARIAAKFTLIPDVFYADYVFAEEQRRAEAATAVPMMMAMSTPANPSNMVVDFSLDTNGTVTLDIDLPIGFGNHAEIFSTYNLMYVPWDVAANRLSCAGGVHLAWIAPVVPYAATGFFIISDADKDDDGDGYSNLREIHISKTDPALFNLVDNDGDGMHDWYEITLFSNLNQTASGDFDGDGLANGAEMVLHPAVGTNHAYVTFSADPSLYDTDGDGMNDYLETVTYPFLDPNDPADADYDHDGLSNWDEYQRGTTLNNWDTDGDTLPDGIEVGQGSSPSNGSDGGIAPDQDDTVSLTLTVGDPSGSHSEIYEMTLSGERTVRLNSGSYGNVETGVFTFLKGNSYTLSIRHVGTSPEQLSKYGEPDYDYTASVSGTGIIKSDPEGIIGYHGDGSATTSPFLPKASPLRCICRRFRSIYPKLQ